MPDRGPSYNELPGDVSIRTGFAMPGDFVEDRLRVLRSDLSYDFDKTWKVRWVATKRTADQDFDHVFAGNWCSTEGRTIQGRPCTWNGRVQQRYAWQRTHNATTTQTVDLTGNLSHHGIRHDLLFGFEHSTEAREPEVFARTGAAGAYPYPIDRTTRRGRTAVRPVRQPTSAMTTKARPMASTCRIWSASMNGGKRCSVCARTATPSGAQT